MQRITVLRNVSAVPALQRRGFYDNVQKRYLATVKEIFPHKTDFPSRHIGPRKTEVVQMLDYIGYKVFLFFIDNLNRKSSDFVNSFIPILINSIFFAVSRRTNR